MSSFVSRFRNMKSIREQHAQQQQQQQQQPSWPPPSNEKKRGRATRIIQTPEPSASSFPFHSHHEESTSNNNNNNQNDDDQQQQQQQPPLGYYYQSTLFKTRDEREVEKDEAARLMEKNSKGTMARLHNRTQSVDDWLHFTGGKKKPDGHFAPHSDNGGNVIVHEPLMIKGKVRRGHQNEETTGIIAKEIGLRQEKRERDICALENGRNFFSLFSEQPKHSQGTAHVKPLWNANSVESNSNTPARNPMNMKNNNDVSNTSGLSSSSAQLHQQQQQNTSTHSVLYNHEGREMNDPLYQKASPAGLPGVGYVDQHRQKQRGKHQYRGAHTLSSLVEDGTSRNQNQQNYDNRNFFNNDNNNGFVPSYLPGIHKKAPDGSRGLRINQQQSHAVDSVKLAFESNPTPIRGRTQFSTTSSSIGNPTVAGELKEFVHGSVRQGPNTRHFNTNNSGGYNNYTSSQFPPVGTSNQRGFSSVHGGGHGGVSSFYRSRTPFPMSSSSMIN